MSNQGTNPPQQQHNAAPVNGPAANAPYPAVLLPPVAISQVAQGPHIPGQPQAASSTWIFPIHHHGVPAWWLNNVPFLTGPDAVHGVEAMSPYQDSMVTCNCTTCPYPGEVRNQIYDEFLDIDLDQKYMEGESVERPNGANGWILEDFTPDDVETPVPHILNNACPRVRREFISRWAWKPLHLNLPFLPYNTVTPLVNPDLLTHIKVVHLNIDLSHLSCWKLNNLAACFKKERKLRHLILNYEGSDVDARHARIGEADSVYDKRALAYKRIEEHFDLLGGVNNLSYFAVVGVADEYQSTQLSLLMESRRAQFMSKDSSRPFLQIFPRNVRDLIWKHALTHPAAPTRVCSCVEEPVGHRVTSDDVFPFVEYTPTVLLLNKQIFREAMQCYGEVSMTIKWEPKSSPRQYLFGCQTTAHIILDISGLIKTDRQLEQRMEYNPAGSILRSNMYTEFTEFITIVGRALAGKNNLHRGGITIKFGGINDGQLMGYRGHLQPLISIVANLNGLRNVKSFKFLGACPATWMEELIKLRQQTARVETRFDPVQLKDARQLIGWDRTTDCVHSISFMTDLTYVDQPNIICRHRVANYPDTFNRLIHWQNLQCARLAAHNHRNGPTGAQCYHCREVLAEGRRGILINAPIGIILSQAHAQHARRYDWVPIDIPHFGPSLQM